ncbi:MAG: hypothetical protein ACOYOQ_14920 [Microthrixaceae bacterium]
MRSSARRTRRGAGAARRGGAAALVVVALASTACGGGTKAAEPTTTKRPTTTTLVVLDQAKLDAALLTLADLPPGWTAESTTTTAPAGGSGNDPAEFLCPAGRTAFSADEHDAATATFTQGDAGPNLLEEVSSAEDATKHFDEVKGAFASCVGQRWTEVTDGEPTEFTLAEVSTPPTGEQSAAYRLTGTAASMPLTIVVDFVITQQGTVVAVFGSTNVQSPMLTVNQFTPEQFAQVVATGMTKIEQQAGSA